MLSATFDILNTDKAKSMCAILSDMLDDEAVSIKYKQRITKLFKSKHDEIISRLPQ